VYGNENMAQFFGPLCNISISIVVGGWIPVCYNVLRWMKIILYWHWMLCLLIHVWWLVAVFNAVVKTVYRIKNITWTVTRSSVGDNPKCNVGSGVVTGGHAPTFQKYPTFCLRFHQRVTFQHQKHISALHSSAFDPWTAPPPLWKIFHLHCVSRPELS